MVYQLVLVPGAFVYIRSPGFEWYLDLDLDLDLNLDHLSGEQDEDSLLCSDHLSFECDLLDLFRCDEDPWDLEYELLLDHDRCLCL